MPADPPRPLAVPASHSGGLQAGADPRNLLRPDALHRDAYLSPAVFRLEMTRLWARTWIFAGHESQVPAPGDYVTVDLATQPCILVRHGDGSVRVLRNRCAHKGAKVVSDASGNTGAFFRCPYHAWAYDTDGTVRAIPRRQGYDGTRLHDCPAGAGLAPAAAVESYRGFVFARLTGDGPTLSEHLGPLREVIDNMLDRSPSGEIAVAGGCLRTVVRANWKIYLENINDTMHAVTAHESASSAAERVWARQPADRAKPLSMQQLLPFGSGYAFFEQMGGRTLPNGHTLLGTAHSLHSAYASMPEYVAALEARHGVEKARAVLAFSPQNAVMYPGLSLKTSPLAMRVLRPLGVDRTLVEAWSFRAAGAPDELLARGTLYNRLVFSPQSVVAHDDLHIFETIHEGLRTRANPWVSLHREHRPDEGEATPADVSGTSEALMRHQYRVWLEGMSG